MTISLQLDQVEEMALRKKAQAAGVDVSAYALQVLRSAANRPSLEEILAPVREQFSQDGMTDEQIAEQYEAEKHDQRAARRGRPFDE
jgi:ribosomal protein L12E/L44/L45/RPP1/RPP2